MSKIKYEKPVSLDAGEVAAIMGAACTDGNIADDGQCDHGFDPNYQSVCLPSGSAATNNCEYGNAALKACGTGDSASWGCRNGNNPL